MNTSRDVTISRPGCPGGPGSYYQDLLAELMRQCEIMVARMGESLSAKIDAELEEAKTELQGQLDTAVQQMRDYVSGAVSDLSETVASDMLSMQGQVDGIAGRMDSVESRMTAVEGELSSMPVVALSGDSGTVEPGKCYRLQMTEDFELSAADNHGAYGESVVFVAVDSHTFSVAEGISLDAQMYSGMEYRLLVSWTPYGVMCEQTGDWEAE